MLGLCLNLNVRVIKGIRLLPCFSIDRGCSEKVGFVGFDVCFLKTLNYQM